MHAKQTDSILYPSELDFARNCLEIRQEKRHSVRNSRRGLTAPTNSPPNNQSLAQLYDSSTLADTDKRWVANLGYGLSNRRYSRAAWGHLYKDNTAALMYMYSRGRVQAELAPYIHLVVDQVNREFAEGYRPVGALLLNRMRILLHQIADALGDSVVGVRTDCV